ncbi:MAG: hypothetical protein ACKPKO_39725, partial [Candidatus Fonsibacter sp.]
MELTMVAGMPRQHVWIFQAATSGRYLEDNEIAYLKPVHDKAPTQLGPINQEGIKPQSRTP